MTIPEGMTPEKLRKVADWLDTYDNLFKKIVVRYPDGTVKSAREVTGLGHGDWNEVQVDLRRWADELEQHDPYEQAADMARIEWAEDEGL